MSIEYPENIDEVASRARTDVRNVLPDSNPFQLRNSFLNSIIIGMAGRLYDIYNQIEALQNEMFPDTAEGDFLKRWGLFKNITRNPASESSGLITITGTLLTAIPSGTLLISSDSIQYATQADSQIVTQLLTITSLTRSGTTAIAVTSSDHHFYSGMEVTIAGANETDYNGTFEIVVTALNQFTYTVSGSPSTPATGTITATQDIASVLVKSTTTGEDTILEKDSTVSFITPISGADNEAGVQYEGILGGKDTESDDSYRERILEAYRNPISNFNVADIEEKSKEVNGVTKVWVKPITPDVGQVTISFIRGNDENIIPDSSEVNDVKEKILEIKPAHVDPDDVIVVAPTPITVNFIFQNISPDTESMHDAVENSLKEAFLNDSEFGETFSKFAYESAIWQTVDPNTGEKVQSFTLTSPAGNISIGTNELAILGTISW